MLPKHVEQFSLLIESTIGGYSALVGICEIRGGTQKNERGPKKCEPTL